VYDLHEFDLEPGAGDSNPDRFATLPGDVLI